VTGIRVLVVIVFGVSLWLGFYLLVRNPRKRKLLLAGLGLVAYAFAVATELLAQAALNPADADIFQRLRFIGLTVPVLLWARAIVEMLPDNTDLSLKTLIRIWTFGLLSLTILFYIPVIRNSVFIQGNPGTQPGPLYSVYMFGMIAFLLVGAGFLFVSHWRGRLRMPIGLIVVVAILSRLPVIEERLDERQAPIDTIEHAVELKAVLAESVEKLRPRDGNEFGTTDEWRYYNALYFPYIAGLKPYSRRAFHDNPLSPAEKDALEWFRSSVPERTLYNWQTSAAELIAHELRDRLAD